MLLELFISNVLDIIPPPKDLINTFVSNNNINENALLNHPLSRYNILYRFVIEYIFNISPSIYDFIIPPNNNISYHGYIDFILNKVFALKFGLMNRINIQDFKDKTQDIINKLNNNNFVVESIIQKLQTRYNSNITFAHNSVFEYFLQLLKTIPQQVNILETINPVTGFKVITNYQKELYVPDNEYLKHLIIQDNYFLKKLQFCHIIYLYKTLDEEILKTLNIISKKKQVILFTHDKIKNTSIPNTWVLSIPQEEISLPKIGQWCLIIADQYNKSYIDNCVVSNKNNIILYTPENNNNITSNTENVRVLNYVYNKQDFWDGHLRIINNPQDLGYTHYINFMYDYNDKHAHDIQNAIINCSKENKENKKTKNAILLVDNRENELSVLSMKFAFLNTGGWDCYILTSTKASEYYKKHLNFANVSTNILLNHNFDIDIYNDILEDIDVWKSFECYSHVLVIQDDGLLVRPGIDKFLCYDYVGAPWRDDPGNDYIKKHISSNMVGNGGFSCRRVSQIINILSKYSEKKHELFFYNINRMPEDVWMIKYLTLENCNIAPVGVASTFSSEEILDSRSIGFHKVWAYHDPNNIKDYFKSILFDDKN